MDKAKVGILGGAGYTGGELIRILLHHPRVELKWVSSQSQAGLPLSAVHRDLVGDLDLEFKKDPTLTDIDTLFLALPHGQSKGFVEGQAQLNSLKIIDLSRDFRLQSDSRDFVYGLPELQREKIQASQKIANPGCFATCIQLALLPLAAKGLIKDDVHIQGITGSTGAGQSLSPTSHFSWRNNNVSVYKAFRHQHLDEIYQSLKQLQGDLSSDLFFIPVRGNFTRGIFCTSYLPCNLPIEDCQQLFRNYYESHPFVVISDQNPDLKQVVNTNKALIFLEKHGNQLLIISMIDNLLKGAAGQAIQNLNLMNAWEENLGLQFKANYF